MQYNNEYKASGIVTTVLFHGIILFLFLYFGLTTPLPLPAEEGILVNFGNELTGSGTIEPELSEPKEPVSSDIKPVVQSEKQDKEPLTQDYEEAPAIKAKETKKDEKKKPEKPVIKKEDKKETPVKKTEPVKQEERKPNPLALYRGKGTSSNDSKNEGITEGKGNQGNPTGSPDSKNYSNISSTGGGGISFNLTGRTGLNLPPPEYNYQVEGIVVVEVTVDKEGNVTQAIPGVKGSTTLNEGLLNAAKKAALKAKFDRKPEAPAYQKGTITYKFRLQ